MSPKISMLLPARGRPTNLKASVASVLDLAARPDDIEILVRLDDNDPHLQDEIRVLRAWPKHVQLFVGSRVGYRSMHEMYNGLAERAAKTSDHLFIWNDDIEMKSKDWDLLLCDAPSFSVQFPRRDIVEHADPTLPVVGRQVYEAMGCMSENAYCDAWISDISAFAGTSITRNDIVFTHHRLDDATLREQNDGGREWARFGTQRADRRAAMNRVIAAPGWAERYDGWEVEVEYHPVDYINLVAGEMKAHAVVLKGRK